DAGRGRARVRRHAGAHPADRGEGASKATPSQPQQEAARLPGVGVHPPRLIDPAPRWRGLLARRRMTWGIALRHTSRVIRPTHSQPLPTDEKRAWLRAWFTSRGVAAFP